MNAGIVCHGSELPFLFDSLGDYFNFTAAETQLSAQLRQYWTNFVLSGESRAFALRIDRCRQSEHAQYAIAPMASVQHWIVAQPTVRDSFSGASQLAQRALR
jgi:hypothetical protein